jgi:arylsulfatase A-like enzyme
MHKSRKSAAYYEGRAITYLENPTSETVPVQISFYGRGKVFQTLDIVRRNYAAEVQYLDRHIGAFWDRLEQLGIRQDTILIFTADHGEALAEHHRIGHGFPLYKEVVQVPLIICYPYLGKQGIKVNDFANHLDILPTILDLLHIRNGSVMRGISLKRYLTWSPIDFLLASGTKRPRTFFYTYAPQGKSNSFSVLEGNLKLIQTRSESDGWTWEMYDLSRDPLERNNLMETDRERSQDSSVSSLRALLLEQSKEAEEAHAGHQNPELHEDQKRMLRDLGYIAP